MPSSQPTRCPSCGRTPAESGPAEAATQVWCPVCGSGRGGARLELSTDATLDRGGNSSHDSPTATADEGRTVDFPPAQLAPGKRTGGIRRGAHRGPADGEKIRSRVGRFEVRSVLGKGAFGTVYRAYDPVLDREVALKTPRFSSDDPTMAQRFVREAKAAARLRHPNIVAVFESGEAQGEPYIASEFVDGTPLSEHLRDDPVDVSTAVDWARQIAEALDYAHGEGIVHRDIKPANIMISRTGRPQVMDFGLAKWQAEDGAATTTEGSIVGTPAYMAPEQARGDLAAVGPCSDQYSVGVVLYEMLCGRTPYQGEAWSVVSQVSSQTQHPPAPRSIKTSVPRDLEACCLKALEKEPANRYANLKEFEADLARFLGGQPLVARPISFWEKANRWRRRNRLAATLLSAIATIVVIAAVVGYILAFQFRDLAATAKREAEIAIEARGVAKREAKAAIEARGSEKTARDHERDARLATERLLIDSYTESGLAADRQQDRYGSLLWFANAAALSANHAERERHNRIRFQSWLAGLVVPVWAFEPQGYNCEALRYHASGRFLLCDMSGAECVIHNLTDGGIVPLPLAGAPVAQWSPDGKRLALALDRTVVLTEFPGGGELDRWEHPSRVRCVDFSGDGRRLVVGGEHHVQVRELETRSFGTAALAQERPAIRVRTNRDGSQFAVIGLDNKSRVTNVYATTNESPDPERLLPTNTTVFEGGDLPVHFLSAHRLIIASSTEGVQCWDTLTKELAWRHRGKRVMSLAVSPDERRLAVGDNFDVVFLDAATGAELDERIQNGNIVNDLVFSPDGEQIATGCEDQFARIFAVRSGESIVPPLLHQDAVRLLAWSPEGTTLATVHRSNNLVRVWKVSRDPSLDFEVPDPKRAPSVKFSADGSWLIATGINDWRSRRSLRVYETRDGHPFGSPVESSGFVSDATFVAQTTLLITGGSENFDPGGDTLSPQVLARPGVVEFHDFQTGQTPFATIATPSEPIAVQASPCGRYVVVLCQLGQVLVVDPQTGNVVARELAFEGKEATHQFIIRGRIRFSPLGDRFAIWGTGVGVEMRRTADAQRLFACKHAPYFVHDVQFAPDGTRFVSCSSDMTARLWDSDRGEPGPVLSHPGWVFNAQFSRDGCRLLTACKDGQTRLWDLGTATVIGTTLAQSNEVHGVAFAADEQAFFTAARDGQVSVWEPITGKMLAPTRRLPAAVFELALNRAGTHLIAAGKMPALTAWNVQEWLREPDDSLSLNDLKLLGEILSSQRINEGGVATKLSGPEWSDRWRAFHERHANHPALRVRIPVVPRSN